MAKKLSSTIGSVASMWKPQKNRSDDPGRSVCRTTCSHCDGFDESGPVKEITPRFQAHLADAHPEINPEPRTRRRRR
ncbi:MAG: hypothetical protein H0U46_04870 [Actinobacteria bacterium]|nr:hypothetical protein [Actinomycetota bacterium]